MKCLLLCSGGVVGRHVRTAAMAMLKLLEIREIRARKEIPELDCKEISREQSASEWLDVYMEAEFSMRSIYSGCF